MTLEDPFFVVKDEVFKALNKTRGLYVHWLDVQNDTISPEECDWVNTELKNAIRSIEWDLEDLEDTIDIVEKNPAKFKLDNRELSSRKHFIDATRDEVKGMKNKISSAKTREQNISVRQPLLVNSKNSPVRTIASSMMAGGRTRYSRLENEQDSPQRQFLDGTLAQQRYMMDQQDEQLDAIGHSIGSLKTVSRHIGLELDEQEVMLDEFNTELENTESKLDSTMKKVAKVLHLSNDRRQWIAIVVLSIILIIVIILFFLI